jgi:SpoVK/Ycf46/Vps4 family AAA+-type ATPase
MNDNTTVFVVMTSNDITKLPPELMRSGRLDTHWYFGIPTKEERKAILTIYLNKKNKKLSNELFEYMLKETNHFTGAELRNAVDNLMRKIWVKNKNNDTNKICVTKLDIHNAAEEVVPVFKSSSDIVIGLKSYAEHHARMASKNAVSSASINSFDDISI